MGDRGLQGVIRLHKFEVDEKRRALSDLERQEEALIGRRAALEQEIAREREAVRANPQVGLTYGAYVQRANERRRSLDNALAELRKRLEAARDDLAAAFLDLKTYEITQASRDERARQERERKDQAVMDEIGLMRHRRRTEGLS